ncbi:hypothetical protein RR46_00882 [Papilio xuthus]|uniref:PTB domain-containing protein n=1 Tax=Papilio xuthus TaxID=66420 RepID=A0A0N0P9H2_PAPXU|nr:hypothetical protein RR46_00882 [Papilio xuthus]
MPLPSPTHRASFYQIVVVKSGLKFGQRDVGVNEMKMCGTQHDTDLGARRARRREGWRCAEAGVVAQPGAGAGPWGDTERALEQFEQLAGLRAYVLEHLATFTVTRETGIVYPADGMRRLLQLEKTNGKILTSPHRNTRLLVNIDDMVSFSYSVVTASARAAVWRSQGIWSQKMQLCLEDQWVLVMDYETGSIMERFPVSHVHTPTAFTSPEPGELYNNVLAFVAGAPDAPDARRELHIFQCHDVPAHALVEELNALKSVFAPPYPSTPSLGSQIHSSRD